MANSAIDLTTVGTTPLPVESGGTAQTTQTAAFDALSPLTTRGDIIYRGASNAVRLAKGANKEILAMGANDPEWVVPALVMIERVNPNGSSGVVTFSSIAATYTDLEIIYQARGDTNASNVTVLLTFNADGSAVYDKQRTGSYAATLDADEDYNGTSIIIANISALTAPANDAGTGIITIPNYAGTTFNKEVLCVSGFQAANSSNGSEQFTTWGHWASTAAISRIDLTASAGNFITGSVFTLYGRK